MPTWQMMQTLILVSIAITSHVFFQQTSFKTIIINLTCAVLQQCRKYYLKNINKLLHYVHECTAYCKLFFNVLHRANWFFSVKIIFLELINKTSFGSVKKFSHQIICYGALHITSIIEYKYVYKIVSYWY